MILIGRAPINVNLGGDGTDLPIYYRRRGGLVISSSIAYYVYAILTAYPPDELKIIPNNHRLFCDRSVDDDLIWSKNHHLSETISRHLNIQDNVTVFTASQTPTGIGLGYSGSMTVALVKALAFWCGLDLEPEAVADLACCIEKEVGTPTSRQDTYAAALGGLNAITFSRSGVTVEPLKLPAGTQKRLEEKLMLFFIGASYSSNKIQQQQQSTIQQEAPETLQKLEAINALSLEIREALESGDLENFGKLLHQSWIESRQLVTGNAHSFDRYYWIARELGALGGKVSRTEKGGILLIYCPKMYQASVIEALEKLGLQSYPFTLSDQGVQIMQPQTQELSHFLFKQRKMQTS